MNTFNNTEYFKICDRYNGKPVLKDVTIKFSQSSFFNKIKKSISKDRQGEVVFCVIRPNGKVIAVRCSNYPEGIYRIPTGGIDYGEDIIRALFRETNEELGITSNIKDFVGAIKVKFVYEDRAVFFYSYLFLLEETGGRLLIDASDDEISEVKEVDINELSEIVESLNNISGKWHDWGTFRYVTSNMILNYLKDNQTI